MANKKINELSVRTPSLSDLMLVGDPSTGYSYKATISSLSTLLEANIALNDLTDVVITSVANGNLLAYDGTNWVNRTLGAYLGGTITQYVRGDGSLGDFAGSGGGGGASVSYYLNGSVNQGTFSGTTYYEMNKTPVAGAGTNFTINANGYIASFITDAGDPALLKIPGGNWNLEFYFSASSGGGSPSFYAELYKYDGTTFTLIASSSASPEGITNGTANDAYFTALAVPETVLTLTDRLAIRVYVTHSGRTITLHTENSNLCQIITTFTTGLTALNNLTAQVQFFATGTSGTDFAISSTTATHTFNLPTASGTNRGALSSADWTTFNGKVGGSGTTNYVPKFTASGTIGNSQIFDNGTSVGVNNASPSASYKLDVTGNFRSTLDANINGLTVGKGNLSVSENTAFGVNALLSNTTGNAITAVGYLAGNANGTSNHNTYIGSRAGVSTTGANNTFVGSGSGFANTGGAQNTFLGTFAGYEVTSGTYNISVGYNTGRSITTGNYNTIIGSQVTGLSSSLSNHTILADGQGNMRLVSFNDGNVYIGGSTSLPTNAGYKLDVNGTTRISGTELRLDNGTTGVINLYSATPEIRFFSGDPTGYRFYRSGTGMTWNSGGSISVQIGGNDAYTLNASIGHIWRTANSGGAALARLDTGGSLSIGKSGNAAVASSIVELSSTTKGFLPPRMTNAQMVAIATPATGLVVYDTTNNKLNVYDGTNWVAVH